MGLRGYKCEYLLPIRVQHEGGTCQQIFDWHESSRPQGPWLNLVSRHSGHCPRIQSASSLAKSCLKSHGPAPSGIAGWITGHPDALHLFLDDCDLWIPVGGPNDRGPCLWLGIESEETRLLEARAEVMEKSGDIAPTVAIPLGRTVSG